MRFAARVFAGLFVASSFIIAAPPSRAATFRVDGASGTDSPGCGSAATPCRSIQRAVNLATSNDSILVAAGIYKYDPALDVACSFNIGDTAVVCILNKQLTILGGFASGVWQNPDPAKNLTTIDGQNGKRGVLILRTGPSQPAASLRMEGFTIRNGRAQGASNGTDTDIQAFGGGFSSISAPVILRDLKFLNNRAQGGNTAQTRGGSGAGGGADVRGAPAGSLLERVSFSGNVAAGGSGIDRGGLAIGGGLFTFNSTLTLRAVVFSANSAIAGNGSPGGTGVSGNERADAQGGGVAFQQGSTVIVEGITATGNQALGGDAGGIAGGAFGGGVYSELADVTIRDAELRDNTAVGGSGTDGGLGAGGGLMSGTSNLTLEQGVVIGNRASGGDGSGGNQGSAGGGGLYINRRDSSTDPLAATVSNLIVADNLAELGAGTVVGGGGGGMFLRNMVFQISHTTFARNQLGSSPMAGLAVSVLGDGVADLDFTIIADHQGPTPSVPALRVQSRSTANLQQGLFAGNDLNTNDGQIDAGTINGLGTMLSAASAKFISPGAPNFDYHIRDSSPAVDAAVSSSAAIDFEKQNRFATPDIGADELGQVIFADGFDDGTADAWILVN